jgi:enoyl-CoA hydratase/carnithine racemase
MLPAAHRALEAILTSEDYDAERAEHYGWVTRAIADAELDDFVNGVAARIASFDKAAVLGAKAQINRSTLPPSRHRHVLGPGTGQAHAALWRGGHEATLEGIEAEPAINRDHQLAVDLWPAAGACCIAWP